MAGRILGPTGSRRRRRFILFVPVAAIAALILALTGAATNTSLNAFEIDGNLAATTTNGTTEDWVNSTNTGADSPSAALFCDVDPLTNCTPSDVTDGSGQGTGELFRDDLKVDPDHTTFTQGDKENDFAATSVSCVGTDPCTSSTPYHIVTGSVPPQKDDLFDITTNSFVSGNQAELDLGMVRTNNNGSSHVDFELNRADWTSGSTGGATCGSNTTGDPNFKCPVRTEGDLLVSFEISPSSTTPPVSVNTRFFVWDLPGGTDANGHGRGNVNCQGPLTGNENTCPWEEIPAPSGTVLLTAVNGSPLDAAPWGSRNPDGTPASQYPAGGWFEAGLDLDALGFSPSCPGFGTASAKARSSGSSVTSALTDLAGPFPVNLNNCAKIHIIKNTVPNALQDFSYSTAVTTPGKALSPSTFSLDDDAGVTGESDTLKNQQDYEQVTPGSYTVTEGADPTGYHLTSLTCTASTGSSGAQDATNDHQANITVVSLGEVTCTYVNTLQLGAIKITKTNGKGGFLQGATFSIKAGSANGTPISGSPFTTNASGVICVGNLSFGHYFVKEESAPSGYKIDDATSRDINVDNNATCADNPFGGESTTFTDTPLSTIQVNFTSLAGAGVTRSNIVCSVPANTENGGADSDTIASNSAADPTVVTTSAAHGLSNGAKVSITGSNSTPSIDGLWTVSNVTSTTFTIPVAVTAPGSTGTVTAFDDSSETFGNGTTGLVPGTYTCTVIIDP